MSTAEQQRRWRASQGARTGQPGRCGEGRRRAVRERFPEKPLDIATGLWLDEVMNSNTNTLSTLVLTDGSTVVLSHRATVVGFANALARKGLTWATVGGTVVDSFNGLTDEDRVA